MALTAVLALSFGGSCRRPWTLNCAVGPSAFSAFRKQISTWSGSAMPCSS